MPPALRRWWRGWPRLALEDAPAAQLATLTSMVTAERLLVIGPDSPPLAALLADAADLQPVPIAALTDARLQVDTVGVDLMRAEPHRLPLGEHSVDIAVLPHQLRRWNDGYALRVLEELWRVLAHNGVAVMWEIAASKSVHVNAVWSAALGRNGSAPTLRTFSQVGQLAYDAGFAWVQTLPLRPFFFPPGPRLTVLARKEHYTTENPGRG